LFLIVFREKIDDLLEECWYKLPTERSIGDFAACFENLSLWPEKEELAAFKDFRDEATSSGLRQYQDWQEVIHKECFEQKDIRGCQYINGNVLVTFRGLQRRLLEDLGFFSPSFKDFYMTRTKKAAADATQSGGSAVDLGATNFKLNGFYVGTVQDIFERAKIDKIYDASSRYVEQHRNNDCIQQPAFNTMMEVAEAAREGRRTEDEQIGAASGRGSPVRSDGEDDRRLRVDGTSWGESEAETVPRNGQEAQPGGFYHGWSPRATQH